MQRVRVGLTGLAAVVVLIGAASAIFTSANREQAVSAIGASDAVVVANMTEQGSNVAHRVDRDEPLAELGVAPSKSVSPGKDAAQRAEPVK